MSSAETTPDKAAIRQSMGWAEWTMLAVLSLFWGGSFFFIGIAVTELPTLTIVALRVGLAAILLWGIVLVTKRPIPRSAEVWGVFFVMGVLNNIIPFGLIAWGQQSIPSGLASILNATTPLFAVVVAGIFLADERATPRKLIGMCIGFIGVIAMIGFDALSGLSIGIWGQIAVLVASLSYALAGVYGRRLKRLGVDPVVATTGLVSASSILLWPVALMVEQPWTLPMPATSTWLAVLGLVVLSTVLAYFIYFELLSRVGATNLLLVTFLIPVSAIILGALFLGEVLHWTHFLGMALIGCGLIFIDGRLLTRLRSPKPNA